MPSHPDKLARAARRLQQDSALSVLQRLAPTLDNQAPEKRLARGAREAFTALLDTSDDPKPSTQIAVERLVEASGGLSRALAELSDSLGDDHVAKQQASELRHALGALLATVWVERPSLARAVSQCVTTSGRYPRREALIALESAIHWHEIHGGEVE